MQLFLYVHTHWDREWYLPFESFRCQLPALLNKVVDGLTKGTLPNFYLDGQAAILTDALEIAPELKDKIKEQMAADKLSAGPWYVLADQMLVSGESLIRNLKLGLAITSEFGKPAMIGYCPDTFGHSQDLPRILKGFGINNAIIWRGVPKIETSPLFWWQSPDGSRVLAYHLNRGYYQTQFHDNKETDKLADAVVTWLKRKDETNHTADAYCNYIDGALCPVGGDHIFPPDNMTGIIDSLQEKLTSEEIDVWSILPTEFIKLVTASVDASKAQLSTIAGELRDNKEALVNERAYLLPGVLSTRLYLKRANRLAEHRITNIIEPLLSILSAQGKIKYPQSELDHAWQLLLQNQPHDSICGCSIDEVHREMMTRTSSFNDVMDVLERRARTALVTQPDNATLAECDPALSHNQLTVFNLSGQTQAYPVRISWFDDPETKTKKSSSIQLITNELRDQLFSGPGIVPYYKLAQYKEAWVYPGEVPGIGSKNIDWNGAPKAKDTTPNATASQDSSTKTIGNDLFTVTVDSNGNITAKTEDGKTYKLDHSLRDVGDGGDTYNFDPIENDKPINAKFISAKVTSKGPLVASLLLTYEIKIPEQAIQAPGELEPNQIPTLTRSTKLITHKITTEISLRKNVPILFFETTWDNKSKDHRLEVLLNTGKPVTETLSENHFSLVKRQHSPANQKLPVEIGHESIPDRFPCQRFFIANNQLFLNTGLPEYAVDGNHVAITLLRAVSLLSRGRMRSRGGGAGPHLPTPEANCIGINKTSYAWAPLQDKGENQISEAYNLAEQYEGRLWATLTNSSKKPFEESLLTIDNNSIRIVSMFKSDDNKSFIRLLNTTNKEQKTTLASKGKIRTCSLSGSDSKESTNAITLAPNQLITLEIHLL